MKKLWIVTMLALLLLSGCSTTETFETVRDLLDDVQASAAGKLTFTAPGDASAQVISSEEGTLYFCDGYEIMVQTVAAGDIGRTLKLLTGYHAENLTIMQMQTGDIMRYECSWLAAGENRDQIGRTVVLDDGKYHYSLSVIAPAEEAGSLQQSWTELFSSVKVVT